MILSIEKDLSCQPTIFSLSLLLTPPVPVALSLTLSFIISSCWCKVKLRLKSWRVNKAMPKFYLNVSKNFVILNVYNPLPLFGVKFFRHHGPLILNIYVLHCRAFIEIHYSFLEDELYFLTKNVAGILSSSFEVWLCVFSKILFLISSDKLCNTNAFLVHSR